MMKQMLANSYLFGTNTPYIEALYDAYGLGPQGADSSSAAPSSQDACGFMLRPP